MRSALGDGYTETLRELYKEIPESSDYVMYWWNNAARLVREGKVKRFGLIATNSLRQTFNRKVVQEHLSAKNPLSLVFAVPDHPWVDSADGAAVRISMTVGEAGEREGRLARVVREDQSKNEGSDVELTEHEGKIFADLTIGADVASGESLKSNENLSSRGVSLHGAGFIVTPEEAKHLGLGRIPGLENHIRHYRHGKDLASRPRGVMVIDLDGLSIQDVQQLYPEVFQHLLNHVKPERDQNKEKYRRENWWLFGRRNTELRAALRDMPRYIATVETSKHRFFVFLDASILPDNKLVNIALDDAYYLGVLSSFIHVMWALAAGGTLEDRPVYTKTVCFEPFPFPVCDEKQKARIRELGEQLDAHRKKQQALHPKLTITDMYNVLEKLRKDEPLTDKEKLTHEQGLVSVLKQIHQELDSAVLDAYGWTDSLTDEEILTRLVELNRERAAEERAGVIRWLRPEYQNPQGAQQAALDTSEPPAESSRTAAAQKRAAWPASLPEQVKAVRQALADVATDCNASELAEHFEGARKDVRARKIEEILVTLAALGRARETSGGRFVA